MTTQHQWQHRMAQLAGELHRASHELDGDTVVETARPMIDLVQALADVLEYVTNTTSFDNLSSGLASYDRVSIRAELEDKVLWQLQ